jgi:hypothetical protein
MAPKRGADSLPAPIARLKSAIVDGSDGAVVSAESIGAVDHKIRNAAFGALRGVLKATDPDKYDDYMQLQDDAQRREWLSAFTIDPAQNCSNCTGFNRTTATSTKKRTMVEVWETEASLAGSKYFNNLEHARLHCMHAKSRKCRTSKGLAKAGILEFQHFIETKIASDEIKQEAGVMVNSELLPEEATAVRDAVANSFPGSSFGMELGVPIASGADTTEIDDEPPIKKNKKEKDKHKDKDELKREREMHKQRLLDLMTPADRARSVAAEQLAVASANIKKWADTTRKELTEVQLVEKKLEAKSWGQAALAELKHKTQAQWDSLSSMQALWAECETARVTLETDALDALRLKAEAQLPLAESIYKQYKKKDLGEFARLSY